MEAVGEPLGIGRREVWRRFVMEAPVAMVLTDLDYRTIAISPDCLDVNGLTHADVVGRTIFELFPDVQRSIDEQRRVLDSGQLCCLVTLSARMPDGVTRWFKSQMSYCRDDDGAPLGYLFVNRDITDEHDAQVRRDEAETLILAVLEHMPAAITVQDVETEAFVLGNQRLYEGLGMSPAEVLGKRPVDLFPPATANRMSQHLNAAARTGEVIESEWTMEFGPSEGRIQLVKKIMLEDAGQGRRLLLISEDVTEARKSAQRLLQAKEDAEAANRAKSTFLATMSHEIRTPLNGVLGMAQVMAMKALDPEQRERLEVIQRSGEALLVILNDVLDFSKIEAGKLELEDGEFDIENLASGVHDIFAPAAEAKGCGFSLRVAPAAKGVYQGDPTRVRQILGNLVSNALKFTEAGEVRVAIEANGADLEMRVTDSGIGMSADQVAALFEKFHQADASTTRRFGGTGLGLAISLELATLMGGSITAESRLGAGSTFTASLPLPWLRNAEAQVNAAPVETSDAVAAVSTLRVLAAEDNKVNQLVLKALLEHIGVEPALVETGVEAVAAWEANVWDLILMDVQMPEMDGPAATRIIRERELATSRPRTPILALTANAMSHQISDYLAAGMDGFIAKPIEVSRLFAAIEAAVGPGPEADRAAV